MRAVLLLTGLCLALQAGGADWGDLKWRELGPLRGGWAETVEGIASKPDTYLLGAAGGGLWRTDNAGRTWTSLFDHGPTAPVGAVAAAPSNPEILYLGTGQPTPRYDVAGGAGVFRSADGGRSWKAVGLEDTRHIGRIWIDPSDPNHVLVAAVGHFFGPHSARGVFLTTDGGAHWTRSLAIDDDTGAVDLAADPADPKTVFATSWQARQYPWQSYFTPIAGPGSALWRSKDGGATWTKVGGAGWPEGPLGRLSVATARTGAGLRLYVVVSSATAGGLYRSDDAGGHWLRANDGAAFANYYSSHVTVAPDDPDVVYLVGQSIRRCDHGGARCEIIRGAPGGDDYHAVWINPKDPSHWASASDQGVAITVDGGRTFSTWYNQPTAQFYHVATDNQFPYRVYSGQQDSGSVIMASRSDYGAPNFRDWKSAGADERDYVIPDPEDPSIVYGTGLGGRLSRYDDRTGQVANIAPFLEPNYGKRQTSVAHHYVWVTPMALSRTGPVTLYVGAESVFKSTDRGQSWTQASPDLGGRSAGAQRCDGDVALADARPCGYGGVWSMATSARHAGEVWVGTDSGLVQRTDDDGAHWQDVTPPGLEPWSKIASVDLSDLEDGVAYVAIDRQRLDDFSPVAMSTHDHGRTWHAIGAGLPAGRFVSVVRADPVRKGLLYAGTETGVFVSFDDGARWSPLQQNLPTAWVRDLTVHGNDLVIATQGRGIWILDDLSPLRQWEPAVAAARAHLFAPATAVRVRPNLNRDTPLPQEEPRGQNPPAGAVIDYWLGRPAKSVAVEIRDATGALVQRLAAADGKPPAAEVYFAKEWLPRVQAPGPEAGLHRVVWNLRWTRPEAIAYDYSIAATPGRGTELVPNGPYALPGRYEAVLLVDGTEAGRQGFSVGNDPRSRFGAEELRASFELSRQIGAALGTARRDLAQSLALDRELKALHATGADAQTLEGWIAALKPLPGLSRSLAGVEADLETTDRAPTSVQLALAQAKIAAVAALDASWAAHLRGDLPRVRAALKAPLAVPAGNGGEIDPDDAGEDLP